MTVHSTEGSTQFPPEKTPSQEAPEGKLITRKVSSSPSSNPLLDRIKTISSALLADSKLVQDPKKGLTTATMWKWIEPYKLLFEKYSTESKHTVDELLNLYLTFLGQEEKTAPLADQLVRLEELHQSLSVVKSNSWIQAVSDPHMDEKIASIEKTLAQKYIKLSLSDYLNSNFPGTLDENQIASFLEGTGESSLPASSDQHAALRMAIESITTNRTSYPLLSRGIGEKILTTLRKNLEIDAYIDISQDETIKKLRDTLRKQKVPQEDIVKIIEGCMSNWEGFTRPSKISPTLLQQIHGIKRLKVYKDPITGEFLADYGKETLRIGGMKRAKEGLRILPRGEQASIVRYTPRTKEISSEGTSYQRDINQELMARKLLGEIPYLLGMHVFSYVSEDGRVKKRPVAEECEGTLADCLFSKGDIFSNVSLTPSDQKPEVALQTCQDSLTALAAMHRKGFVHLDIKPANILFLKGRGRLSDLGFCSRTKESLRRLGSPGFMAPELLEGTSLADPKMDMFSFGMTLLALTDPKSTRALAQMQLGLESNICTKKAYLEKLSEVRNKLNTNSPLENLIFKLINPDPNQRPEATSALVELQNIKTLPRLTDASFSQKNVPEESKESNSGMFHTAQEEPPTEEI